MSIIAWVITGLVCGFVASRVLNRTHEGTVIDIALGTVGAVVGGIVFHLAGATSADALNVWSVFVAAFAAMLVLSANNALMGSGVARA